MPRDQIFAVPQHFTPIQALMLEPLGVAIHAIDLAKPRFLETVAIVGCGPIGLKLIQLCKLRGVGKVYAVDPLAYRVQAAIELAGADCGATSNEELADMMPGRGADLVIEATNSPEGFERAAELACIGGRIVLVGIPDGNEYNLHADTLRRKALQIKTSRRMGHVYPRAIELVNNKQVDVDSMITHEFALDQTPGAFHMQAEYQDGAIKSIININD